MAKLYVKHEGELLQPQRLLNLPGGDSLIDPTPDEVREMLAGLTLEAWEEGDAGLLSPNGDLIFLFAPGHGYFLQWDRPDHPTVFLARQQPSDSAPYMEVEAGYQYSVRADYFVPFETLWQAVHHLLEHGEPDPSLTWTEESPYAELE